MPQGDDFNEEFERLAKRIDDLESMVPDSGTVPSFAGFILPLVALCVGLFLKFEDNGPHSADAIPSNLVILALIGFLFFKVDRVFEYIKYRFDMLESMFELMEEEENGKSIED